MPAVSRWAIILPDLTWLTTRGEPGPPEDAAIYRTREDAEEAVADFWPTTLETALGGTLKISRPDSGEVVQVWLQFPRKPKHPTDHKETIHG